MERLKSIMVKRRKYKSTWLQKLWSIIPTPFWKTQTQALKRKQYVDGEKKYNEELDWVSIIKSIRELKLLTKVVLNHCQRQTLAFDKANLIPVPKALEESEETMLMNYIPKEEPSYRASEEFYLKLNSFIHEYSSKELNDVDYNIIEQLSKEDLAVNKFSLHALIQPRVQHTQKFLFNKMMERAHTQQEEVEENQKPEFLFLGMSRPSKG